VRTDSFSADYLASTDRERAAVAEMLVGSRAAAPPPFWELGVGEQTLVPTAQARIRAMHFRPPQSIPERARGVSARRPIVLVPGFGATPPGFQDFYAAAFDSAELYYIETREKPSSVVDRGSDMSVAQSAADVQEALAVLGLTGNRDYVLVALCWGAAIVLEGMIRGMIDAPTVLLCDPMHALWFPKWVLRFVSPLLPVPLVRALRPLISRAMIGGMKEPAQKQRATEFVASADIWKWKMSAEAARDFDLLGRLGAVSREVFVLNGTADRIHDPRNYPQMAREMPRGRFLHMPTEESNRELLFGVAALEFARIAAEDGLPRSLSRFERHIR
jgi:pimeloyl-ACP methyl ester carboxylesterase